MEFSDIKFEKMQYYSDSGLVDCGFCSQTEVGNFILSVQCAPQQDLNSIEECKSFEVSIWKKGLNDHWCTQDFIEGINNNVANCQSVEDVNRVLYALYYHHQK